MIILTVHGMGETSPSYAEPLRAGLQRELGSTRWSKIVFEPIYYQDVIQSNQYDVWSRMRLEGEMDWSALRKFMLFSFSDAATLEHHSEQPDSAYIAAQKRIRSSILTALTKAGDNAAVPVVLIAHSLGCQVLSNYIWDSQSQATKGVWRHDPMPPGTPDAVVDCLKLRHLKLMLTTGCNIPLFVAGLDTIKPFNRPDDDFLWKNYYDRDDALGWPLRPLSPGYKALVKEDVQINSGGILKSWTPFSHEGYWTDKDFIKPAARLIRQLQPQ